MKERVIELVNGELDGTNTSPESAELADIVREDAATRAFFDETKAFFGILEAVPEVDPPPELKERIMEFVDRQSSTARAANPETGFVVSLRRIFEPLIQRPAWVMSYAFVAGLLFGVAVLSIIDGPVDAETGVVQGTIGQPVVGVLDEATLEVGGITVDLVTMGTENEVVLDITISGSGDATLNIQASDQSDAGSSIIASGPGHFTVSLEGIDGLVVTVTSAGQERTVRLQTSPV